MVPRRTNKALGECRRRILPFPGRFTSEIENPLAQPNRGNFFLCPVHNRPPDINRHRVPETEARGKRTPTFQAECVPPKSIEVDRDDGRRFDPSRDKLNAALERLYMRSPGQPTFR